MKFRSIVFAALVACAAQSAPGTSLAQEKPAPPADESVLGEFVVTGTVQEHIPKIAVLPSLSPAIEDVIVRSVVRRDLELTGLFDVVDDRKAPPGLYGFDDPVDVPAWQKLGAEAIVKVAARNHPSGKIEVLGIAYFLDVGKDPVYEKKLLVDKDDARITAHRITDALLGALTGRPGGFASQFTYSGPWARNRRIFTMDSDGHGLMPRTDPASTAIAPTWGKDQTLYFTMSERYSPFRLYELALGETDAHPPEAKPSKKKPSPSSPESSTAVPTRVDLPFRTSVYSVAFDKDYTKMAIAVAEHGGSSIYVGKADGTGFEKVSKTDLATHPVFSPSGKLAWLGGSVSKGTQRVYMEGKAISPAGFTAAAPAFCDTEDGIRLVYAVSVAGDRQDLIMSNEQGRGIVRLTQNQGSNSYPACSPDGRMLAFFSTRKNDPGLYVMSLKRFTTLKVMGRTGESLRWAPLPPPTVSGTP